MKKKIADKWIKALYSGEYKQGKGALLRNGEFCCLGVLCDLAEKEGVVKSKLYDSESNTFSFNGATATLPHEVREWAGINSSLDNVITPGVLIGLNDKGSVTVYPEMQTVHVSEPFTFEEIGDLLQGTYKEL